MAKAADRLRTVLSKHANGAWWSTLRVEMGARWRDFAGEALDILLAKGETTVEERPASRQTGGVGRWVGPK